MAGRQRSWRRWIWVGAVAACAPGAVLANAGQDCADSTAPVLAVYRSVSPLLAVEPAHVLSVTLRADGCATTQFPAHYIVQGERSQRIPAAQFAELRAQLGADALVRFDAAAVRQKHQRAATMLKDDEAVYRVFDENMLEIELHPAAAPKRLASAKQLSWASVRNDLFAFPDDKDLVALAAVQRSFDDLVERQIALEGAR